MGKSDVSYLKSNIHWKEEFIPQTNNTELFQQPPVTTVSLVKTQLCEQWLPSSKRFGSLEHNKDKWVEITGKQSSVCCEEKLLSNEKME